MNETPDSGGEADAGDVDEAREAVIEAIAATFELYGLQRSNGWLYGILYFAEGPLSLDELVERSGYAKSTVSTAMTTLERYYMVRRRSIPGEGKRVFFEAERDWWRVVDEFVQTEGRRELSTMTRALDTAEQRLEESDGERAETDLERVRQLKQFYRQTERLVDVLSNYSPEELITALELLDEQAQPGDDSPPGKGSPPGHGSPPGEGPPGDSSPPGQ